jgi:hypothetical protein
MIYIYSLYFIILDMSIELQSCKKNYWMGGVIPTAKEKKSYARKCSS